MSQQLKMIWKIWVQVLQQQANLGDHAGKLVLFCLSPVLSVIVGGAVFFSLKLDPNNWMNGFAAILIGMAMVAVFFGLMWYSYLPNLINQQHTLGFTKLVPKLKRHFFWAWILPFVFLPILAMFVQAFLTQQFRVEIFLWISVWMLVVLVFKFKGGWLVLCLGVFLPKFDRLEKLFEFHLATEYKFLLIPSVWCIGTLCFAWILRFKSSDRTERKISDLKLLRIPHLIPMRMKILSRLGLSYSSKDDLHLSLGLPSSLNWMNSLLSFFLLNLGFSLGWILLGLFQGKDVFLKLHLALNIVVLLFPFATMFYMFHFVRAIYTSKNEQALLLLSPKSGTSQQFSRRLLRHLLKQFFLLWIVSCFASTVLTLFVYLSFMDKFMYVLAHGTVLPLCLLILSAHQKRITLSDHNFIPMSLACFVLSGIAGFVNNWLLSAILVVIIVSVVFFAYFLKFNRQSVHKYSQVFPAGRAV